MEDDRTIVQRCPQIDLGTTCQWRPPQLPLCNFLASTMADLDLLAVCSFLNDLSLDEIITYDSDDDSVYGDTVNYTASSGATSDENSDWEDAVKMLPNKTRQLTKTQRDLQRQYGEKSRGKKKAVRIANYHVFLAMLDKFVILLHVRLEKTEREFQRLCLAKMTGEVVSPDEAETQLELNEGPLSCIEACLENWKDQKKSSKFFFRDESAIILPLIQKLADIGERLKEATAALKWRLQAQTTGVWV